MTYEAYSEDFQNWRSAVDRHLHTIFGVRPDEIKDMPYFECYAKGDCPEEAAMRWYDADVASKEAGMDKKQGDAGEKGLTHPA